MNEITQRFPRKARASDRIEHLSWTLDLDCALGFAGRMDRARLEREAAEMAEHFPRWILTAGKGRERVRCRRCAGPLVFWRGLRCALCGRDFDRGSKIGRPRLAWFGLLPPIGIGGLARIDEALRASTPEQHVLGERPGIGRYFLVPLVAAYPSDFPRSAVRVHYLPGFFRIRGMPPDSPSHATHLYGQGQMCLFAGGEWQPETTCRQVLQQRAYAHVVKLLNYANGKRRAFAKVS
ncbi:MAG: hypothetical protein JXR96_30825 [Deltaproteobacteria bacterium]|nr:hypothetical protein [Deltaproteobacteria bacterium]